MLLDWGDTLMVDSDGCSGPMVGWEYVEAIPHARDTLRELRSRGWRLALATNAGDSHERNIRTALARVEMDELLDRVYCSSAVGYTKPAPEYFDFIKNDLGVEASELVMVGDHLGADVIGANRAGLRAVWLSRDGRTAPPDDMRRTICDLAQLPGLLDSWV